MAEARILVNGVVIRTDRMTDFTYNKFGSVMGFTIGTEKYRFCTTDIKSDYYALSEYHDYLNKKMHRDSVTSLAPFVPSNFAKQGDEIYIYRREMSSLQTSPVTVWWQAYRFPFTGEHPGGVYYGNYKLIPLPAGAQSDGPPETYHSISGNGFFNNYIPKAATVLDQEWADILADIQLSIDTIEGSIFNNTIFSTSDAQTIITAQRTLWTDNHTYDFPTKEDYKKLAQSMAYFRLYFTALKDILHDDVILMFIYMASVVHYKALEIFPVEAKLLILHRLAMCDLDNFQIFRYKPQDDEAVVVRVIHSITTDQATMFLKELIDPKSKYTTGYGIPLFYLFWDGVNNPAIGVDNRKSYVFALYEAWKKSTFNPYRTGSFDPLLFNQWIYNNEAGTSGNWGFGAANSIVLNFNATPFSLNYQSKKFIGIYWDDYDFYFHDGFANHKWEATNASSAPQNKIFVWKTKDEVDGSQQDGLRGTYHLFQPISLVDTNQDCVFRIPVLGGNDLASVAGHQEKINNLIPAFFLKYLDDAGDESNFYTTVGYFVDIVSIFAGGAGVINKLRYLRNISKFGELASVAAATYIAIGLEGLQVLAGAARFLTNFVDDCDTNSKWQKIRTFLMWLEVGTGALDILATRNIKRLAKDVVDDFNSKGWPPGFLNTADGALAKDELIRISGMAIQIGVVFEEYLNRILDRLPQLLNKEAVKFSNISKMTGQVLQTPNEIKQIATIGFEAGLDSNSIAELLHISRKWTKQIETSQLFLQVKYYAHVTVVKGYPAGFKSVQKFADFCTTVENYWSHTLSDFDTLYGLKLSSVQAEFKIQGSVLRKRMPNDPWPTGIIPADYAGLNVPDDIEYAILMAGSDFDTYLNEMELLVKKAVKNQDHIEQANKLLKDARRKGSLPYKIFAFVPKNNSFVLTEMRQASFIHTTFDPKELRFAIIKRGATLDLGPYLPFKH